MNGTDLHNTSGEDGLNYNSPSSIKAFLDARGLSAQKRFGQHFLINAAARAKLVKALDVHAGDAVWEIGPGLGAMTRLLLDRGARVTAFEIDRGFADVLHRIFAEEIAEEKLTIVVGDALKTWPCCSAQAGEAPLFLLGNLPYNIAGALLGDFIEKGRLFSRAAVTMQKEAAARITARSGDKDYSSLAVLFALVYETRTICSMKGGKGKFFYPSPNVDSTALCFYPKKDGTGGERPNVPPIFFPLVRALFSRRRKTIYNNLCCFVAENGAAVYSGPHEGLAALCETALFRCGIAKNARAENLTADDFRKIAECLTDFDRFERKDECT
jgi:16S rRNA (adenine1518-N6/adenine1519-N6)-dimethyltransferase